MMDLGHSVSSSSAVTRETVVVGVKGRLRAPNNRVLHLPPRFVPAAPTVCLATQPQVVTSERVGLGRRNICSKLYLLYCNPAVATGSSIRHIAIDQLLQNALFLGHDCF